MLAKNLGCRMKFSWMERDLTNTTPHLYQMALHMKPFMSTQMALITRIHYPYIIEFEIAWVEKDSAAVVIDHTSYAVSDIEGDHTLIASDDFIQADVILGREKIEQRVLKKRGTPPPNLTIHKQMPFVDRIFTYAWLSCF